MPSIANDCIYTKTKPRFLKLQLNVSHDPKGYSTKIINSTINLLFKDLIHKLVNNVIPNLNGRLLLICSQ